MTPEQLETISRSAAHVTTDRRAFAESFYGKLFEIDPDLRPLFRDEMSEQYDRLVGELDFLAAAAQDLQSFSRRAFELGRRHTDYGVTGAMFPLVREALLHALHAQLGDEWDADHSAAWSALFDLISQLMLDGAAEASFTG